MRKKRLSSKLRLTRETVRRLNPEEMAGAAGGFVSSSENCTQATVCTHGTSYGGGGTYCICPGCPNNSEFCGTTGPIYTAQTTC